MNGHMCNTSDLVQRIAAHMMASTNLEKGDLLAHKDKATTPPHDVEEKRIEGKTYHYNPRHQVESLTREVLSDTQKNHPATTLKKIVRQLTNDAVLMASTDLEKGCLPAYKDEATTPPYSDEEKRVRGKQHIHLPRREADALMLTRDVLYHIHNSHRAARLKKRQRQVRTDAIVVLILKILMVLSTLALMLFYAAWVGLKGVKVDCSRPGPLGLNSWYWIGGWHSE